VRFKSAKPRWDGTQDLAGKTILVLSEQGYGDTLQFCRFIPLLKDLGATVHFVVLKPLIELMQQVPGVDQLFDETDILPQYDFTCELMSLPHVLNVTLENLPANTPYIVAPEKNLSVWRSKIDTQKTCRVGIVWGGNPSHTNNHLRSIPMSAIRVLFEQNAEFIVLQKEATEEERAIIQQYPNVQFLGDQIDGFGDTAALVELVDLVITVDTSVAHLAGAMGKNTWVLVSHHPDWRWLLQRADSPWYPSVRLFRQQYGDAWSVAVGQVAEQLLAVINPSQAKHF
jgi:ADP-heptose:LPS heptosyltransferase